MTNNKEFDVLQKKSKDYFALKEYGNYPVIPKSLQHLSQVFNLSEVQFKNMFLLPCNMSFEPYIKAFQHKVINYTL